MGRKLTVGSLFSGIGGFDLGFERAGFAIKWQVEIDPFCRQVLEKHWPHVTRYFDVRQLKRPEAVDVLCGGFPCQPVALGGLKLRQRDARWLWPDFARIVRLVRPRYIVVENVPGLRTGGGMDDVLGDLAALGFDAEWESLPATFAGLPHLRDRVWLVAYAGSRGCSRPCTGRMEENARANGRNDVGRSSALLSDAERFERDARTWKACTVDEAPSDQPGGHRGFWSLEPDVGRVAHGIPARVDRLRGLGNALVPQIAQWIAARILDAESEIG